MAESHCLYFWPIHEDGWGHISLNVWYPEKNDQIYISHWPKLQTIFKRSKGQTNQESLFNDIKAEGNRKPEVVQIPFNFLNPAKINEWLDIETQNPEKLYNFFKWNCADVVCKALQIGLKSRSLQHEVEQIFMGARVKPVSPNEVFTWVQNKVRTYKSVKQQPPLPDSASVHLYPCAPLKPTDNFSGRSTHLFNVCEALKFPDKTLVVTAGTGGVGKTEFARKVAQEVFDFFEGRVFWMDSETKESLQKCLLDLSTHLKIPHDFKFEAKLTMSNQEMKKLFHDIYSHFSTSNQNSLFIFDNANQFKPTSSSVANESIFLISDFLPNSFPHETFSPCPAVLITSRSSDWSESEDFQMTNLQNFTLEETLEYFNNSFPETYEEQLKVCEPEIQELHRRFDGYTLAFTLAAGWIRGSGHSQKLKEGLKCYLQFFERPLNNLHKKDESSSSLDNNYKFDPHEIMEQTCAAIEKENPLALKLLKQMSFLSPDFLNVHDCFDLNEETPYEQIVSALDTLSKFSVIKMLRYRDPWYYGDIVHKIQIHRVIQQLVKESQTKSKDVSVLFKMCETLLQKQNKKQKQENSTTLPHLKSLLHNLQELKETLPFWFFNKKPQCDDLIEQLGLKIKNLKLNYDMTLKAIHMKLRNVKPPIAAESVMDNSKFLDESNQLYKIKYQELADFALLNLMETKDSHHYEECSVAVVKQLVSLGIWPQFSLVKTLSWLRRRSLRRNYMELELDIIKIYLTNPHTTPKQRQELEHIQMEFKLKNSRFFDTEKNAQTWLNILQHQKTLHGLTIPLTDEQKIDTMQDGIEAAVNLTTLDDHKYSQFLNLIRENSKVVDNSGNHTIAQILLSYLPRVLYLYEAPPNMQRFTEILLLLFNLAQPFPSKYLNDSLEYLERKKNAFEESMDFKRLFCRFTMMISILSVSKSEEFVSQIDSFFKRLFEISKSEDFKDIETNCQPRDRDILKGLSPYLKSFVEQNQDSKDENAKKLVSVVQSLILIAESTE